MAPRSLLVAMHVTSAINHAPSITEAATAVLGRYPSVTLAYLFGSVAKGCARPDSDVDIAVLLTPGTGSDQPMFQFGLAAELEKQVGQPVDLVVLNSASPVLQHEVIQHGQRLQERDPAGRAFFELSVFKRYQEHRYYQERRQQEALNGQ
jgi:predicted nucleotidyltransferase